MLTFLVFLHLQGLALALPGYSSYGTQFVTAVPVCKFQNSTLYLLTPSNKAEVKIYLPGSYSAGKASTRTVHLEGYKQSMFDLNRQTYAMNYTNVYDSIRITSDSVISVTMYIGCNNEKYADFIELIPKDSCHTTYYLTSWNDKAVAIVSSFDKPTKLKVKFPKYSTAFHEECVGDVFCQSGKEAKVQLGKYETWFFRPKTANVSLQNTVIEADNPIFVITGNIYCKWMNRHDLCLSHARPKSAWGLEYAVPYFRSNSEPSMCRFRVNVDRYPFKYFVHGGSTTLDYKAKDFHHYHDFKMNRPIVVSADRPFGLNYYYYASAKEIGLKQGIFTLQNLIPVEQWMNGNIDAHYVKIANTNEFDTVLISTATTVRISHNKSSFGFNWDGMNSKKYTYIYRLMRSTPDVKYFFTDEPSAKVIVYQMHRPTKVAIAMRCLGFYQGTTNPPDCIKLEHSVVSDGVDNDCDGTIDEEFDNGEDDDGDGFIDEDNILFPRRSEWTQWQACKIECDGQSFTRKVRSCRRELFASQCPGTNEQCDDKLCSQNCSCKTVSKGCVASTGNPGKCDHCKNGYVADDYCLLKCKFGWSGYDCTVGPRSAADFKAIFAEKEWGSQTEFEDYTLAICLPIILFICFACVFVGILVQNRVKKRILIVEEELIEEKESMSAVGSAKESADNLSEAQSQSQSEYTKSGISEYSKSGISESVTSVQTRT